MLKLSDIDNDRVVSLASEWKFGGNVGVVDALIAEGVPRKLALKKVESLVDKGLLQYGVSPWYAWPA